jgi:hypothetical protein
MVGCLQCNPCFIVEAEFDFFSLQSSFCQIYRSPVGSSMRLGHVTFSRSFNGFVRQVDLISSNISIPRWSCDLAYTYETQAA